MLRNYELVNRLFTLLNEDHKNDKKLIATKTLETAILIKAMKEEKIDLNEQSDHCEGFINFSVYYGYTEITKLLLAAKVKPNGRTFARQWTLPTAAERGHTEIVKLLLDLDEHIFQFDNVGFSALDLADMYKHKDTVELLLYYKNDRLLNSYLNRQLCKLENTISQSCSMKDQVNILNRNISEVSKYMIDKHRPMDTYHLLEIAKILVKSKKFSKSSRLNAALHQAFLFLLMGINSNIINNAFNILLSYKQWLFLAMHALGNYDLFNMPISTKNWIVLSMHILNEAAGLQSIAHHIFENKEYSQTPSKAIHFAIRAVAKAEKMASTSNEKMEVRNQSLSIWGMYRQVTNPLRADHKNIVEDFRSSHTAEAVKIIEDYLEDNSLTEDITKLFNVRNVK